MSERLRVKSSRPEYRRAGFVFSSANWTVIDNGEASEIRLARLLADDVLHVEYQSEEDSAWLKVPASARAAAKGWLDGQVIATVDAGQDPRVAERQIHHEALDPSSARTEVQDLASRYLAARAASPAPAGKPPRKSAAKK